ncbi:Mini-ribonuclease 3 [Wujia sp.]|jgi:ribonuclease-3 family protein|uniref:Mini-ribonuclease 3 n=1 Tax=Wujia sp. TaxID=2944172 RepID=UPI000E4811FE|nr:hypothetical protein DWW62_05370 [Clostridium sp. AF16-25]RGH05804.1 hypothetical protein DWW48_01145 [Clostridium sp. AF15-49]RGH11840.1 hypothetical protein DWW54_01840 [Clostridium sp. AF15-6B]RHS89294.1 hypothetical protein DW920_01385 [Clostridium sp. AM42-36]
MEESVKTEQVNAYQYSPLALAYMGDSILDLLVKKYFVTHSNMQPHKYHVEVSKIVKAVNQADYIDQIMEELSEDELDVYKRGRNTNTHSKAKNATMGQYRKATGLEALYGYLYLKGDMERLQYFVDGMIKQYLAGKEQ